MKTYNYILALILIIFTSCSNESNLVTYSETCACVVSEHFGASTDETENSTKEFTFKNSPLLKMKVPKYDLAQAMAIMVNKDYQIGSSTVLRINVEKANSKTKSFEFYYDELNDMMPIYDEIHHLISGFVENIYAEDYSSCKEDLDIEIDEEKYLDVMNTVKNDLETDYIETKIVGFKKVRGVYNISAVMVTESKTLDLFFLSVVQKEGAFKIIEFSF